MDIPKSDATVNIDFLKVKPSKTIKKIVMLNCNSAYVDGLKKAFPNVTDWKLNDDDYFSTFSDPEANQPIED